MKGIYRVGILSGLVAPWWWAAMIVICAALWPGYDHTQQFISELGANGSPTQTLMVWAGFYVVGVLYTLFGIALVLGAGSAHRQWRQFAGCLVIAAGLARLGTGYFPCETGCMAVAGSSDHFWHHIFARIGYFSLTTTCLVWAVYAWRTGSRRFAAFSVACGVAATITLALLQRSIEPRIDIGVYQRIVTAILSGWIFCLAASELRLPDAPLMKNPQLHSA